MAFVGESTGEFRSQKASNLEMFPIDDVIMTIICALRPVLSLREDLIMRLWFWYLVLLVHWSPLVE